MSSGRWFYRDSEDIFASYLKESWESEDYDVIFSVNGCKNAGIPFHQSKLSIVSETLRALFRIEASYTNGRKRDYIPIVLNGFESCSLDAYNALGRLRDVVYTGMSYSGTNDDEEVFKSILISLGINISINLISNKSIATAKSFERKCSSNSKLASEFVEVKMDLSDDDDKEDLNKVRNDEEEEIIEIKSDEEKDILNRDSHEEKSYVHKSPVKIPILANAGHIRKKKSMNVCEFCSKDFGKNHISRLQEHYLTHFKHEIEPLVKFDKDGSCSICFVKTKCKSNMLRHFAITHRLLRQFLPNYIIKTRFPNWNTT